MRDWGLRTVLPLASSHFGCIKADGITANGGPTQRETGFSLARPLFGHTKAGGIATNEG